MRPRRRKPPNPALDLFGEVPLTWPEVYNWLETVPRIPRDSWRAHYYIKYWDVPGKILQAKLQGNYEKIIYRQV